MAKATLTLLNGTTVVIEGSPEEVQKLVEICSGAPPTPPKKPDAAQAQQPSPRRAKSKPSETTVDHAEIVNLVKTCDEAQSIETQILDRPSQVNRTLLPLYIGHEHLGNAVSLTSGDISKIATDLGVPISQGNASRTLSKTAFRYVVGDKMRKKGRPVRYKLSRRGVKYMKSVLADTADED